MIAGPKGQFPVVKEVALSYHSGFGDIIAGGRNLPVEITVPRNPSQEEKRLDRLFPITFWAAKTHILVCLILIWRELIPTEWRALDAAKLPPASLMNELSSSQDGSS